MGTTLAENAVEIGLGTPIVGSIEDEVDLIGCLGETILGLQTKLAKNKTAQKLVVAEREYKRLTGNLIVGLSEGVEGSQELVTHSPNLTIVVSKATKKTTVTEPGKLVTYLRSLSEKEFLSLVNFKITELREYLPGVMFKKVTTTEHSGSRRLKITRTKLDPS